jgi:hypothetical protein
MTVDTYGLIRTLDHVAVISNKPRMLFSNYERLGFLLTPFSQHSGSIKPGEPAVQWGTGNRCAMFREGYLELLAVVDPNLFCRGFSERVERYEGLHIVALGCENAEKTRDKLTAGGVGVAGIGRLERVIAMPVGESTAAFSLVRLAPEEAPECHLNILEHHTPELLWQERYLNHPNGAVSLNGVTLCLDDPASAAKRYSRFLGVQPKINDTRHSFILPRGRFDLISADDHFNTTDHTAPTLPFVASFIVGTKSLTETRTWLRHNSIGFKEKNGRILVGPEAGCGATCIFE